MVTSSRRPDSWIVPGGGVEPEEEPAVTALREVREEAGVLGQLGRCLGIFEVLIFLKNIIICSTQIEWKRKYRMKIYFINGVVQTYVDD